MRQRCNVTIDRGTATITIQNDDPVPRISINDVTLAETNSGTRSFNFFERYQTGAAKKLQFSSRPRTAARRPALIMVRFPARSPSHLVDRLRESLSVLVNGDPVVESDENFFVNLTNPAEATLVDAQGVGTIQNDDLPPVLLLEENSSRAAALEVTTLLRDPFPLVRGFQLRPPTFVRASRCLP